MANLFRSVTDYSTDENFVISFVVNNLSTLAFGMSDEKVSSLEDVDKVIYIDNKYSLIDKSNTYYSDGDYITKRKTDNSTFFGKRLEIYNGNVYEEISNASEFDPDNSLIKNKTVYKYIPGKYIFENGVVKLSKDIKLTCIFSFENGEIKNETYLINDELSDFQKRLRFVITNENKIVDIAKSNGEIYEKIITVLFKDAAKNGYIYLYLDDTDISHLQINGFLNN